MFSLILILLLLAVVLGGLLTAWSVWFQGYLYTEAGEGLLWRGPAAGAALAAFVAVWVVFDYRSVAGDPAAPGRYRPLYDMTSAEEQKPFAELRVPTRTGEEVYRKRPGKGPLEYRLDGQARGKQLPSRPDRIVVVEGDDRSTFEPERDAEGKFKPRRPGWWSLSKGDEPLRYVDEKGRVMREGEFGRLTTFHGSWLVVNLLLNFLLLGAWFLCLWLLLRFQWPAALGQAVVFWGVMLLFLLPPLLTRAENVARERAAQRAPAE